MAFLIVGSVAVLVFGNGLGLLNEPDQSSQAGTPDSIRTEQTTPDSTSETTPDPAFDALLSILGERTDAPIMLPAFLPNTMDNAAIDGYVDESPTEYGVVFPSIPTEAVAQVGNDGTIGTLQVYPEDDISNEYFDAGRIEEVALQDGTEATLRYMVPSRQGGSQGPFWEGKFDRDGYTFRFSMIKPRVVSESEVRRVLFSMVPVSDDIEATSPEENIPSADGQIEAFVFEYYDAVEHEDWTTTYLLLADESKQEFTEEEWIESQEIREETDGGFSSLESADIQTLDGAGAIATLFFSDGSSGTATVSYSTSVQNWRRYLSEDNIEYLRTLLSGASGQDEISFLHSL